MNSIYQQFGIRQAINASGTLTRVGGTLMWPEVVNAMVEASKSFVKIEDLQEAAGKIISAATGAEAGYVSNGAAGGLMMATAACVAGLSPEKMDRLPDTSGMKNEVIIQRYHRNSYDHAIRAVGVKIMEVGYSSGPGTEGTLSWQLESAINENTAAIAYPILDVKGTIPLLEVIRIAHLHNVPVIVDAAAALPPVQNLRKFIDQGADLVIFSGGKALHGPQASGIIAGRQNLISSIALQQQDMDVMTETWTYRERFIESGIMSGPPHMGICRVCKVGKEEIVGLIVALQLYIARDHEKDMKHWWNKVRFIKEHLDDLQSIKIEILTTELRPIPQIRLHIDPKTNSKSAAEVVNHLLCGDPLIVVGQSLIRDGIITINPISLEDGQEIEVVERLRSVLINPQV